MVRRPAHARGRKRLVDRDSADGFGAWHLAIDVEAATDTKERYGFVVGDFSGVQRSGLIAAKQRAAQFDHDEVETAANELLALLDETSG